MNAGFSPRLEVGHLSRAWSKNSPPGLGGVPRAINSSRESERRGGRSTSRSHLIGAREANRIKKEGFASIYKEASVRQGKPGLSRKLKGAYPWNNPVIKVAEQACGIGVI